MAYGLPSIGEGNWGQKILDSFAAIKATADAAQPAASLETAVAAKVGANGALDSALSASYAAMAPLPNGSNQTAALQAILDAGKVLRLHPGTYFANLTVGDNATIIGAGTEKTIIKSVAGSNADVIKGSTFDALTGVGHAVPQTAGDNRLVLKDLTIDGNRANNTSGYGIRIWGIGHRWDHVLVRNCAGGGIFTEFDYEVTTFSGDDSMLEAHWTHITTAHNGGNGWTHRGPHDSYLDEYVTYGNDGWGWVSETGPNYDGGIHGSGWNSYLNTLGSYRLGSNFNLGFVIASGASGVGVGVEIQAGLANCAIKHLLTGGHHTGLILRGSNHHISGHFATHTTDAIRFAGTDSCVLDFTIAGCTNGINATAGDGGEGQYRGIISITGVQTATQGSFASTSSVSITGPGTTNITQLPGRTVTYNGGYVATFPLGTDDLVMRELAQSIQNKSMGATNTYRGLSVEGDVKPSVTGSRGGNAALASLLTALAGLGVITDGSSA